MPAQPKFNPLCHRLPPKGFGPYWKSHIGKESGHDMIKITEEENVVFLGLFELLISGRHTTQQRARGE